ncbi:patatin-like phospholipase family protein [Stutzerimonas nitrititolerans]|uniref:patatin-like phospholipase family protein n=1 Tax=Stutzerimonas nitrititolerans TaxID=2482751 RepID=UPI00071870B3|nr:patatin-like phospholipase family protein [Stutzerimonas nitrititolerans]KRW66197.1 phospholipase [Pseudomonas sp. TTU2014-066ASC]
MKFNKLGLTLSGGGGKGAYQIGVWQAMRELGLDSQLSAIAGTSVGGLNGAMFAQGKFNQARDMWLNIESRNMLTVQDVPGLAAQLASMATGSVMAQAISHFVSTKGFFKQDGLKSMISEGLNSGRLASSALPLTVALHNTEANRVDYLEVRDAHTAAEMLLGTAALPMIFDEVRIQGSIYSDGGFYWGLPHKNVDNTPIIPLIKSGCDTIIVVYLSPDDLSIDPRHYPGVRILPVVPTRSLGGVNATLDFSNQGAARRMEQGYNDGLQLFRHLELFLSNEAQYEALWERARLSAEEERKSAQQLQAMDRQHGQTVYDIHDFDRTIRSDDFSQKPELADDDETPLALDQLALENTALLADIERCQIETAVDSFIAQNANNRRKVEGAVLDALSALSPVTGRANHMREQGVLSRLWGTITGKSQQIAAENDRDLAQAQFAALRLIAAVQEKGAVTLEFACALQNRLNSAFGEIQRLGKRHNRDLRRVYRSLAGVYCKLRERLSQHEDRLSTLERQGRLHNWLLHPNRPRLDGQPLARLPVPLRLACIANDFYLLTEGNWSPAELVSLKEMCINTGLDDSQPIRIADFCAQLSEQPECARTMTERLVILPEADRQPGQPARWLRDLRNQSAEPMSSEQALTLWGYGSAAELPAWDFLAELLYHLKVAGFSVVHGSDLSRFKAGWLDQLKVLDELVGEKILPNGFRGEIVELREAISGFHLKVPLIGKFSVGKSTLLNCWLGEDIQKDDLGACTSLATEFHYALPGEEKLVIHWLDDLHSSGLRREERELAAYRPLLENPRTDAQPPLFVELHLNRSALARHPDLILVDTPGFGSGNGNHERALQQYIGEGAACILCVTRSSQIGIDELGFINRQRSLGQEFSLLVCQEALNTPSQREALRRQLAEQAGLDPSHPVRGCSAREGDLSGLDDLLAQLETRKGALFQQHLAPRVEYLLGRAERLIRQQLALDTTRDDLLDQRKLLERNRARLEENYASEQESLLRDCRGPITRQVVATVNSYLRSRRSAYAQILLGGQSIGPLLTADARNACQLAVDQNLTPRLKDACQNLGSHIELNAFDGPTLAGDGPIGIAQDQSVVGATLSAATGAAIGSMIPLVGTLIGGLLGGVIGLFVSGTSKESEAEGRANEAIESIIGQLQAAIPELLEKHAGQFLAAMRDRISAQLDVQRENIERIDQQLSADELRKQQIKERGEQALERVAKLVAQQPALAA